ncbi:translation initiation factor IF-2-like [Panthera tigris]|uniref:translation initiation factor IF-2-like n=1 Tax=Panthera tigris TaxID=9694 RepID=UPI001C6F853A|nr:translation initiation factor IF-2-like [Panthera tigris]
MAKPAGSTETSPRPPFPLPPEPNTSAGDRPNPPGHNTPAVRIRVWVAATSHSKAPVRRPSAAQRTEGRRLRWGVGRGPKPRNPAGASTSARHARVSPRHPSRPTRASRGAPPPRRGPGCSQEAVPGPWEGLEVGREAGIGAGPGPRRPRSLEPAAAATRSRDGTRDCGGSQHLPAWGPGGRGANAAAAATAAAVASAAETRLEMAIAAAAATAAVACAAETRLEMDSAGARVGVRGCSRRQYLPAGASRAAQPSPTLPLLPALLRPGWRWILNQPRIPGINPAWSCMLLPNLSSFVEREEQGYLPPTQCHLSQLHQEK